MDRSAYEIGFRDWDEDFALVVEDKGWYPGASIRTGNRTYGLEFYDPVRLSQTIATELEAGSASVLGPNVVVVPKVTMEAIVDAVEYLARHDFSELVPDDLSSGDIGTR